MKPGRNPWSFFMQKNNENLGKTLTYGAPYEQEKEKAKT